MVIIFTCTVCETRSIKQFSESAPVVLVRCPGCQNLHLLVDRLGWFADDEYGKTFDIIQQIQKTKKSVTNDNNDDEGGVLELTLEELVGSKDKVDKLLQGENNINNDKDNKKKEE